MTVVEVVVLLLVLLGASGVTAIVVVAALTLYPQAKLVASDIFRALGFLGTWARKTSVADEIEGRINVFVKTYNAESFGIALPECDVQWVTATNYARTLTPGTTVVRVAFGSNRSNTLYDAVSTFVHQAFLPRARTFLRETTEKAVDLVLTHNVLRATDETSLTVFNERFRSEPVQARETYYKLEHIDDAGLLNRVLLHQYQIFGEVLGERAPHDDLAHEADRFLEWLHDIATREPDDRSLLHFDQPHIRVGVVLVASPETYNKYGLDPYLRRCMTYASRKYRTVYLLARGRRRVEIAHKIARQLEENGGFELVGRHHETRARRGGVFPGARCRHL